MTSTTITRCAIPACEQPMQTHGWDTLSATGEPVRFHDVQTWGVGDAGSVTLGATEIPGKDTSYSVQVEHDGCDELDAEQLRQFAEALLLAAGRLDEITAAQR